MAFHPSMSQKLGDGVNDAVMREPIRQRRSKELSHRAKTTRQANRVQANEHARRVKEIAEPMDKRGL